MLVVEAASFDGEAIAFVLGVTVFEANRLEFRAIRLAFQAGGWLIAPTLRRSGIEARRQVPKSDRQRRRLYFRIA